MSTTYNVDLSVHTRGRILAFLAVWLCTNVLRQRVAVVLCQSQVESPGRVDVTIRFIVTRHPERYRSCDDPSCVLWCSPDGSVEECQ